MVQRGYVYEVYCKENFIINLLTVKKILNFGYKKFY